MHPGEIKHSLGLSQLGRVPLVRRKDAADHAPGDRGAPQQRIIVPSAYCALIVPFEGQSSQLREAGVPELRAPSGATS